MYDGNQNETENQTKTRLVWSGKQNKMKSKGEL